MGLFFLFLVMAALWTVSPPPSDQAQITGTADAIGRSLFTDYLLPFEVASLLILIALMGAIVFAKKDS
jgi:NADH:ubiquinone oxidoreductase subunit 6 (subunit J)